MNSPPGTPRRRWEADLGKNRPRRSAGRTDLAVFTGSAHPALAQAVAKEIGLELGKLQIDRFPDGEIHVSLLQSVRGCDVYIVQPTGPPVEGNLIELLLIADACLRAGARRRTIVIPYFGYARQDRRASGREPVGARLVADLIGAAGLDRVVAIDLHTAALEGFFSIPLEHLTAVPTLAESLRRETLASRGVVVAPDLGAARLADRYGKLLDLPVAIVHKTRISGREVSTRGVTGDVEGRQPLIVDDMISTGGTVEAAARALAAAGSLPVSAIVATHGLFVADAGQRLAGVGARRLVVTDTVALPAGLSLSVEVVSVAPLLATAIQYLHEDRSLADLASRG
ncbi:MAG TPA: ribose-phosphate pyrophosphokinase [Thermoanaerobaculia bacterium]|nr:ribose-phosphate pyrophosphokinase [Thermoanaerobaculia bacterium]